MFRLRSNEEAFNLQMSRIAHYPPEIRALVGVRSLNPCRACGNHFLVYGTDAHKEQADTCANPRCRRQRKARYAKTPEPQFRLKGFRNITHRLAS